MCHNYPTDTRTLNNALRGVLFHQIISQGALDGWRIKARFEAIVHQGPIFCSEAIVLAEMIQNILK